LAVGERNVAKVRSEALRRQGWTATPGHRPPITGARERPPHGGAAAWETGLHRRAPEKAWDCSSWGSRGGRIRQ